MVSDITEKTHKTQPLDADGVNKRRPSSTSATKKGSKTRPRVGKQSNSSSQKVHVPGSKRNKHNWFHKPPPSETFSFFFFTVVIDVVSPPVQFSFCLLRVFDSRCSTQHGSMLGSWKAASHLHWPGQKSSNRNLNKARWGRETSLGQLYITH